jgi:hypothetical protein
MGLECIFCTWQDALEEPKPPQSGWPVQDLHPLPDVQLFETEIEASCRIAVMSRWNSSLSSNPLVLSERY